MTDLSATRVGDHRFGAVRAGQGRVILFVMDQNEREPRVAQETTASVDESRETTTVALGPGRMLANPRRVRRA